MNFPVVSATGDLFIAGGSFKSYHVATRPSDSLERLEANSAPSAIHTSAAVESQDICLPGTRTFTLDRLRSLATSSEQGGSDIIWMHGPAGAGKSAIMRTMANMLEEEGLLLASFFFFRAESTRNTSTSFIPTLAFQASSAVSDTQSHILESIRKAPSVFSQSTRRQSRLLLETPLVAAAEAGTLQWTEDTPLAIVVDGLDECMRGDQQVEIIRALARLTSAIRRQTKRRLKVIIASRPEHSIKSQLKALAELVTIIELCSSDANIELFYDTHLDKLRNRHGLPPTWPSPMQIRWLRGKTSGQYSFAHTSMGFLGGGDPVVRLDMLMNNLPTHGLQPFESLDALYATILRGVPPEMLESTLLFLQLRLHPEWDPVGYNSIIECLLGLPSGYIARLSPYLSSLIDFDASLTPYHASLADFLFDSTRSSKHNLFVHPSLLANRIVQTFLSLCNPGSPPSEYKYELLNFSDNALLSVIFDKVDCGAQVDASLRNLATRVSEMDLFQVIWLCSVRDALCRVKQMRGDTRRLLSNAIRGVQVRRLEAYEKAGGGARVWLGLVYAALLRQRSNPGTVNDAGRDWSRCDQLLLFVSCFALLDERFASVDRGNGWSFCGTGSIIDLLTGRTLTGSSHRHWKWRFLIDIFPDKRRAFGHTAHALSNLSLVLGRALQARDQLEFCSLLPMPCLSHLTSEQWARCTHCQSSCADLQMLLVHQVLEVCADLTNDPSRSTLTGQSSVEVVFVAAYRWIQPFLLEDSNSSTTGISDWDRQVVVDLLLIVGKHQRKIITGLESVSTQRHQGIMKELQHYKGCGHS